MFKNWAIVDINSSSHAGEQIDACSKTSAASCLVLMSSGGETGSVDICPNFRFEKKYFVPFSCAARWTSGNPSSILGLDTMLRKAGAARVNRRLLRYYLIVRRLPNVFTLACRSLGSIYYDTGSPRDGKTPFGWLHPCRLVTDSRRYLIIGAPATMPLHSSFIFTLNNRASTIS